MLRSNEYLQKANDTKSSLLAAYEEYTNELENLVNKDSLTNLYNHNYMYDVLDKKIKSSKKSNRNLSVLMIDIDDFKRLNDKYGHQVGNIVLKKVSRILLNNSRETDIVGRYGGEEFTIVLNRNSDEESELISNRILKIISSNKLIYMGSNIYVTASIGLTKLIVGDTPEILLSRADKALYISKENGKNQVSKVME